MELAISDNGVGFGLGCVGKAGSHGLVGLNERGMTVLGYTLEIPFLNSTVLQKSEFYKLAFYALGVRFWLAWLACLLALVSSAGLFPELVSSGTVETLLSRDAFPYPTLELRRRPPSIFDYVYEDFEVGDIYQHPLGRTVLPVDNSWFTLLSQNTNPIHFDRAYAAQTEFGQPLVDSTFTLALVTGQSVIDLSINVMANLGWDEVRLPNPLFEGETVYSR